MGEIRVRYRDSQQSLAVTLIQTWRKGELPPMDMSTSGGPKDQVRNMIHVVFDADPEIDAVSMVIASGTVFLIIRKGKRYFDITHKEVEVVAVKSPPGGLGKGGSP